MPDPLFCIRFIPVAGEAIAVLRSAMSHLNSSPTQAGSRDAAADLYALERSITALVGKPGSRARYSPFPTVYPRIGRGVAPVRGAFGYA
jgi:hypothetical protein